MGSNKPGNSTRRRAEKAHSVKRPPKAPPPPSKPRVPPAIELAIDAQRASLETAITLLYCLHSALRREIEDAGRTESEAVESASESADVTHISAMLLVQLDSIHCALDPSELVKAIVDQEALRISELAREQIGSDERESNE